MSKISNCLWFDDQAEAAAIFYVSLFKNSKILNVSRYGEGAPLPAGTVLTVDFELDGTKFIALNGGPMFTFSEAVSFSIDCADQAEVDHFWNALTADGGQESQCGWLKDKFGVSWPVVPSAMPGLISGPDPDGAGRAMAAMMGMKKLDIAELQKAYDGE
ncbi:VOC family protein [Pseudarthrobacter sp. J1738]|uniref:VOC family protein n=1 Tax=Pseudarthrobacter sp. J1738 TaxID=3420446 RepID=UPI003D2E67C3